MATKDYLREKASEILLKNGVMDKTLYERDLESLVEELSIYQIELEHQNQQLMETQEKVLLSQNRYLDLFNNAPVGYFILDSKYKITEVNHTACSMMKIEYDLLKGTSFTKWIHPEYQDQFYFFFKDIFKNHEFDSCEIKLKDAAGRYFYVSISAVPSHFTSQKEVSELRIAVTDISLQKELEARLITESEKARESERLKSAFLANMSHEIRTPLNGILGFASLIFEDEPDKDLAKHYAEIIWKNGDRLLGLITKILDLSKIESGTMTLDRDIVSPNLLVDEVIQLFQVVAMKQNDVIIKKVAPELQDIKIYADQIKLIQILSNLLSNALKFTRKGSIEIGYTIEGNNVLFSVKDTGIGISKEGLAHLFERFYQVNTKSAYNTEGSGLGLSLCKSLVELMKGRIWVDSEQGVGACFSFVIPFETAHGTNDKESLEYQEVLLVEDDIRQAHLIKVLLEKQGLKVCVANNGIEALTLLKNNASYSMILMDINMPIVNGFEVSREIRKKNLRVPIVAITGFSTDYTQQEALLIGFNEYVIKPLTNDRLSKIVKRFIHA
jgi:PAS domain S-box-containing protein